nr:MAG TPA: hypothetical protein [Caudoviricetes sp.]
MPFRGEFFEEKEGTSPLIKLQDLPCWRGFLGNGSYAGLCYANLRNGVSNAWCGYAL